jgi:hypothetical protein
MEGNNAEELKNQLTQAKCEKVASALGPREYRERNNEEIGYDKIGCQDIPYLQTNGKKKNLALKTQKIICTQWTRIRVVLEWFSQALY